MKRFAALLLLVLPATVSAQSHPVFVNSPADNARFAAWKANYDANPTDPSGVGGKIYKFVKDNADGAAPSGDSGQWAALVYRMGGGASYADLAYTKILAGFLAKPDTCNNNLGGNYLREHGWVRLLIYDWIYDQLDAGERTAFLNKLNTMAACSTGALFGSGGDSDQTTGAYFLSALLHASTTSYNATINTMWNDVGRKWGGYAATGMDTTTYRNAIGYYASILGNGGMWPEATEYNLNTLKLACVPSKMLRDIQAPTNNYPDLEAFCADAPYALIYETIAPNHAVNRVYSWGDTQNADQSIVHYRGETAFALAGVNIGKTSGPYIQDWILDYLSTTTVGTMSSQNIRGFLHFDPDATRGDYTTLPLSRFFPGMGVMIGRTGWAASDAIWGAHMPGMTGGIHHAVYYFGEFQIWKNGHWPFTHPLTYGGIGLDWRGSNGVGLRSSPIINVADNREYKAGDNSLETKANQYPHELDWKIDTTNNFVYLAGTKGGSLESNGAFGTPPTFTHEYSRSFVFLQSLGGALVVHDRTNIESVADGACNTGYSSTYMTQVNSGNWGFKDQFFHMPTVPTTAAGVTTWPYASGTKTARINHLLPLTPTIATIDEVTLWGANYASNGVRRGYHIRIRPPSDQRWDTFLNVLDPYESGTTITTTLVQDTTNKVDAALLARSGTNVLVAFNAIQGPDVPDPTGVNCANGGVSAYTGLVDEVLDTVRLRQTGYTLSFTGPGGGTKAILLDLDPSIVWTYTINAGAPSAISEDAMGVATIDIANTGAITLAVLAGGQEPSVPVVIQTTSLPASQVGQACGTTVLVATGGDDGPYTWSKTAGNYPTGCSIDAGGTYSGTATVAGTFNFTMQACDSTPECDTQDFEVIIADVPTITAGYDNATVNVVYSDTLTVTGGTPPYTCVKNSGSVGAGLTFNANCSITGTPTTAGTYSFNVTATDNAAASSVATDMELVILPETVLTDSNIRVYATESQAIVNFGTRGMDAQQDCTVNLLDGAAIMATVTSTEGDAMRTAVFENLEPDSPYTIDVDCPGAVSLSEQASFRTKVGVVRENATEDIIMSMRPSAAILARNVAKVSVRAYATDDLVTAVDSELHLSCGAGGCSVTLTLPRPDVYVIRYDWETAANAVVVSSRRDMYRAIP